MNVQSTTQQKLLLGMEKWFASWYCYSAHSQLPLNSIVYFFYLLTQSLNWCAKNDLGLPHFPPFVFPSPIVCAQQAHPCNCTWQACERRRQTALYIIKKLYIYLASPLEQSALCLPSHIVHLFALVMGSYLYESPLTGLCYCPGFSPSCRYMPQ